MSEACRKPDDKKYDFYLQVNKPAFKIIHLTGIDTMLSNMTFYI